MSIHESRNHTGVTLPFQSYFWNNICAAAAKSLQSCPTLCDPVDGSPPGSPVPGILQARALGWVAISFSNAWMWKWSCSVMSDSVSPQRRQPTRLPRPWDSPGKNTGVGCHFLLQCMNVKVKLLSRVRLLATPWTAAYQAPPSMGFARQEYWSGLPLPSPQVPSAAATAKSLQSCPTLCGSPPGSPIPEILQARTLEWVAISFSSAWKWKVKVKSLSRVWLLATPWTAAYQAPPPMGFSRQEYWSGVPLPSPMFSYI